MKITNRIVESYLNCKYKAYLSLKGESNTPHEYELLMNELRDEYRPRATEALLRRCKLESAPTISTVTVDDLKQGHPLILYCTVQHGQFECQFDALKRIDGNSCLGSFYYAPVIFINEETIREQHKMLLASEAIIIGRIQQQIPAIGFCVVGPTGKLTKIQLANRNEKAIKLLDHLEQLGNGAVVQNLRLTRHCDVCEFRERCKAEALEKDDLSLLSRISDAEIEKHNANGIFTVTHLSYTFRPRKKNKSQNNKTRRQLPLQALAIREKKVFILDSPQLPEAPVHVYLDFEGDQARKHPYLLGGIVSTGIEQRQFSLWSDDHAGEADILEQLLVEVSSLKEFVVFHYGSYELDCLKAARNPTNADLIDRIVGNACNVLSVIYKYVYFPTYSNALKDIGSFLGCIWSPQIGSGSQSLYWRRRFEAEHNESSKHALVIYNQEDCLALQRITEFLYGAVAQQNTGQTTTGAPTHGPSLAYVEDIGRKNDWTSRSVHFPDFDYINKCAYFDYQREHVFVRHNKQLRKQRTKRQKRKLVRIRTNRQIEITAPECPECDGRRFVTKERRKSKWAFDLIVTTSGIRRHVTKCMAPKHICQRCGLTFIPEKYERLDKHGHALKSWAMYQHVEHRLSTHRLEEMFRDIFGLPVHCGEFIDFKILLSNWYQDTYNEILAMLKAGIIIHADETPVTVKTGKGYVWVLASLEDVLYIYRPNREGAFLPELLEGFDGVLISDFYGAYDSLPCSQQKCLIHFIRDLNSDLIKNPFDEEFKEFVAEFSDLMKSIVSTIDRSGLKKRVLKKHRKAAKELVRRTLAGCFQSTVMESYRGRIKRYADRMFTFLEHDGVPWNNAHAEHAVRRFAYYRDMSSGYLTVEGLEAYLALLSISQTCAYRGIRFLDFLLSQEKSIAEFSAKKRQKRLPPTISVYPDGFRPWSRKEKGGEKPKQKIVDNRIHIGFLKNAGRTVPEIMEELDVTRRAVVRALEKSNCRRKKRKSS